MIRISIPVESHVRKFLVKRYGETHTASQTSLLGMEVLKALTEEYVKPYVAPDKKTAFSSWYDIDIPEFYFNSKGHSISCNNLLHLGIAMGKYFVETMCYHIDMQVGMNKKAQSELKIFLEFYNINEDDAKLESLYKVYQRHCKGPIKTKRKVV